ncbi:hypothetical protein BX265_0432 [Streptomyces sp. TLI_235]|nr:hypothetical protein [Streptomyces sp. TLI_235]PBC75757.1 hypothetical protein BX265_0432 [Streptomyces sp. TLI_235]
MDAYEELLALARGTARTLLAQGVAPRSFRDDGGSAVEGWVVDRLPTGEQGGDGLPLPASDVRSSCALVLDVDGRFHRYRDSSRRTADSRGRAVLTRRLELSPATPRTLVGLGPGRPFDQATVLLEQLPWTAVARRPATRPLPAAAVRTPARPSWAQRPEVEPVPVVPDGGTERAGAAARLLFGFAGGCVCATAATLACAALLGDAARPVGLTTAGVCVAAGTALGALRGRHGAGSG